jgi:hypothetical protein
MVIHFLDIVLHQLQAMFIGYPMIFDMTILALVSYVEIMIDRLYRVYPDSIINCVQSEQKSGIEIFQPFLVNNPRSKYDTK